MMTRRTSLDWLEGHQDRIPAIICGAEPLLRDPGLRDVAGLARARWALMRVLTAYASFKHRAGSG